MDQGVDDKMWTSELIRSEKNIQTPQVRSATDPFA